MVKFRIEKDSLGDIKVPSNKLWGAQTQRSVENFKIGVGKFHFQQTFIKALAFQKKAAALTNHQLKNLSHKNVSVIVKVCDDIIEGEMNEHFPLVIWQTGSGTQINMNFNEVIANKSNLILGAKLPSNTPLHPNDDINKSQSSNDTIPTAMHIATLIALQKTLLPEISLIKLSVKNKIREFKGIIKVGRTHTQDATPLNLSDEFSAYLAQLNYAEKTIKKSFSKLLEIAQGGTAVGSGINAHKNYGKLFANNLKKLTKMPFKTAPNKFESLASHDVFIEVMSGLEILTSTLFKMANDLRVLASGPRSGIAELILPANEPGSSIMPGKINPTQCEALSMVCAHVIGLKSSVLFACTQGHFQLNVYNPVIIHNTLDAINLLSDGIRSFTINCLDGVKANKKRINELLNNSLMLITPLTKIIGYDLSSKVALNAHKKEITLKESCLDLTDLTSKEFDILTDPKKMV
jgi:fumarate hydratase class II|tara:strand:+ start:4685 stop:6073 length:1389 start_codon:yes stop_codon:yes gene_type:complete